MTPKHLRPHYQRWQDVTKAIARDMNVRHDLVKTVLKLWLNEMAQDILAGRDVLMPPMGMLKVRVTTRLTARLKLTRRFRARLLDVRPYTGPPHGPGNLPRKSTAEGKTPDRDFGNSQNRSLSP